MARPRKEPRESFGSTLKKELMDELKDISMETGVPLSKLFDQSVELLIEKRKKAKEKHINVVTLNETGEFVIKPRHRFEEEKMSTPEKKSNIKNTFYDIDLDDK